MVYHCCEQRKGCNSSHHLEDTNCLRIAHLYFEMVNIVAVYTEVCKAPLLVMYD